MEGTPDYERLTSDYKRQTITKLVKITNSFINSLQEHLVCFPEHLKWLIRHIASIMSNNYTRSLKEVSIIFVYLIRLAGMRLVSSRVYLLVLS